MKKIFVISTSRADYGLLFLTLKKLNTEKSLKTDLIVAGSHNSKTFGKTLNLIKQDKIKIFKKIIFKRKISNALDICSSVSYHIREFSKILIQNKPDLVLLLGDRYEVLSFAISCHFFKIKIAHIGGGDITEGSLDNSTRFAISNFSNLHFTTNEISKKILKNKIYSNDYIFNVGSPGVELIQNTKFIKKENLEKVLDIKFKKKIFLITLHPATLDKSSTRTQITNLLKALEIYQNDTSLIFTFPNEDEKNDIIISRINSFKKKFHDVKIFKSLGRVKYFSLLKISNIVIGNSSSGIYEAPYLKTPTVNIGERQKGRIMLNSIFNADEKSSTIIKKINAALRFKKNKTKFFYNNRKSSNIILKKIKKYLIK